jgi:hypothetical protein
METHAAAVLAANYLPHARVLADSFKRHHPSARLTLLLVDDPDERIRSVSGAELLRPRDVGVDDRELHRRALLFDLQGVISSLRGALLSRILDGGAEAVLLLDADMLVLAALDDIVSLTRRSGIVLSPHTIEPLPGQPNDWPEEELLRSGAFSGGFLGVGRAAAPFLAWLGERSARDCLRAPERGLLYTQTWLDLVPALFQHHVLRDPGVNAQVHALHGRDVTWERDRPRIGDMPLRLYHFAGFDPGSPERLCRYYAQESTSLVGRPGLQRLCLEYAELLRRAGWPPEAPARWERLASGEPVDPIVRAVYRRELLAAERGEGREPPDPFDGARPRDCVEWLRSRPSDTPSTCASRYLLELHASRADLSDAFPAVPGADEAALLRWAASKAGTEIPPALATVRSG